MRYLRAFRNWRIIALTIMSIGALLLILGESESMAALLATKAIGFIIGAFIYKIGRDWYDKGLISEIDEFNDDE